MAAWQFNISTTACACPRECKTGNFCAVIRNTNVVHAYEIPHEIGRLLVFDWDGQNQAREDVVPAVAFRQARPKVTVIEGRNNETGVVERSVGCDGFNRPRFYATVSLDCAPVAATSANTAALTLFKIHTPFQLTDTIYH